MGLLDAPARLPLHRNANEIWAIGDSITANGNTNPTGTADYIIGALSYLNWTVMLSNGRLRFGGIAATASLNSAEIITAHLATVVAARPAYCVVHAGTNDFGVLTQAQSIANLTTIYETLLAAGITPIATTMLPKQSLLNTSAAVLQKLSVWIADYARKRGFPLVDWTSPFQDLSNGGYLGGSPGTYNQDNTHPNAAGAKIMGQAVVDAILPWLPPHKVWLPSTAQNAFTAYQPTQNNAVMLDSNADGEPDYLTKTTATGSTYTVTAMSAGEGYGNWFNMQKTSTGTAQGVSGGASATPGNRFLFVCKVKTSGIKAAGSRWHVRVTDSGNGDSDVFALRNITEDITLGVIAREFVLPAGTSRSLRCVFTVDTAATATLSVGQIGLVDLTTAAVLA